MSRTRPHNRAQDGPSLTSLALWPRPAIPSPPSSLTQIVGREAEISSARDLLVRREVRLLTLIGPGGVGKTRLAEAVAAAVAPDFPDGVAWISLAPIRDAGLVLPAVVRGLSLSDARDRSPFELLVAALQDARLLLVLDNLEQVLDAAPDLAALLTACPSVSMLATSRARLRVRGESVLQITPLPVPAPDTTDPTVGAGSDAVRLFLERGRAAAPGIEFSDEATRAAAEICRRVDGLPLGIELAAAWANVLPPEAIRDRLQRQLPLPSAGPRDLPARQRTLRDTIAWSHDLLSEEEQALFRRLSVFAGGFTLDAAEAVAGSDILAPIQALVDQSLVRHDGGTPGGARYDMLETVREYAADRLSASGEEEAFRRRHAEQLLAIAEELRLLPLVPADPGRVTRLDQEGDNLRAALGWWERSGDTASFVRLVTALGWYWWVRSRWREGKPWLERASNRLEASNPPGDCPPALAVAFGLMLASGGELSRAEDVLKAALARARETADAAGGAAASICLGWVENQRGHHDAATAHLETALTLATEVTDQHQAIALTGHAFTNLGTTARGRGQLDLAVKHHERGLDLRRQAGDLNGVAHNLVDLGLAARERGDVAAAASRFREGLRLIWDLDDRRYVVMALEGIGWVYASSGDPARAVRALAASQQLRDLLGLREDSPNDRAARERAVATCRAALSEEAFGDAWSTGMSMPLDRVVTEALDESGDTDHAPAITLTPREQEVLPLLAAGLTDRAIGAALHIGERTVQSHVARIFAKLGVRSRAAATAAAISAGLIEPPR